jgi:phage shock protein PspC (stress-responsive transcriptional regulator)
MATYAAAHSHQPFCRVNDGRWLGGVCAGIARNRALPLVWLRITFVLLALLGGFGALVYVACWMIVPNARELDAPADGRGAVVVLARAVAAVLGVGATVALVSALAIFGLSWIALLGAVAVLLCALTLRVRLNPAWPLLGCMALTAPAVAVLATNTQLTPETRSLSFAPARSSALSGAVYHSGLGTMLIDLRHTSLPTRGTVTLRIDAGLRRTVVALPSDRCVHMEVRAHIQPFLARVAAVLTGRSSELFSSIVLFGGHPPPAVPPVAGPTLRIDFTSAGGSLYVRDYPDRVNPNDEPDWPGYPVTPEPRPSVAGESRLAAQQILSAWAGRHRMEIASERRIERLMPGPCASSARRPS